MNDEITRLTVNITEASAVALDYAAELTGDTRTESVGRALRIYNELCVLAADGGGRLSFELIDGGQRVRVEVNRPWWRFW